MVSYRQRKPRVIGIKWRFARPQPVTDHTRRLQARNPRSAGISLSLGRGEPVTGNPLSEADASAPKRRARPLAVRAGRTQDCQSVVGDEDARGGRGHLGDRPTSSREPLSPYATKRCSCRALKCCNRFGRRALPLSWVWCIREAWFYFGIRGFYEGSGAFHPACGVRV